MPHPQQPRGGGNVQRTHASFPNGRRKTQRIAHGAAPCGHHHGRSCQTMPLKHAQKLVDGIPRFQAFSSAHRHLNDGTGHGVFHVLQTVSQQVLRAGFFMHPKDPMDPRCEGPKAMKGGRDSQRGFGVQSSAKKKATPKCGLLSGTTGIRTWDTRIFNPLLYQLSYGTD